MRIAYLTCVYPPYPGGIGIVAQGLAREMARRGHEAHIYSPYYRVKVSVSPPVSSGGVGDETVKPSPYEPRNRQRNPVTVHYLRSWLRFGNAAFLAQLLWRLKGFDVVHMLYPFFGVAELVPFFRVFSRAKIVMHHTMEAVDTGWRGKVFKLHSKYIMPGIFRTADFVIVLSEDYYKNSELARLSLSATKGKFGVVPNGVDTTLFQPMMHDSRFMIPTILFVGGLDRAHYFKGVDVLIKACGILRDRGITFVCQIIGDGNLRPEYEKAVKEMGLLMSGGRASGAPEARPPYIQFVGLVPHDQLPAYYQRATVCVVPATERIECFSIVAAEAQACGIPVIVTDFPGVRVTIEDGKTGYVVRPKDPEDLARKIQELVENPQKAKQLGAAGRQRAVAMYSWEVVGGKLEEIYEKIKN